MSAHMFLRPMLLIAGLLVFPAIAANVINIDMPVSETVFDPCTNEDVNLVGSIHAVVNLTVNNNTAHVVGQANEQLEGTGVLSGASYQANVTAHIDENAAIDPATQTAEATVLATGQLIGLGDVPNANMQVHGHLTVNANGTVTAMIVSIRLTCN